MTELLYGDNDDGRKSEAVKRAADRRIREAALDLIDRIEAADDDTKVGVPTAPDVRGSEWLPIGLAEGNS